jgi:TIR domain
VLYDLFICHASEDKDAFVRPLAKMLRKEHVEVWFDEFSLVVGDSLRAAIDKGLAQSRFGIVVLSPSFFSKRWATRELSGLVAREMAGDGNIILPVWHGVDHEAVVRFSPPLADVRAIDSKKGVRHVTRELMRRVRPKLSPLIVARDELMSFGLTPPVVTDEWWLRVVVDSSRMDGWGMHVPEEAIWGRWSFPLPDASAGPESLGLRLAWTALQRQWSESANEQRITQVTRPDRVLSFIASQVGLAETCHDFPFFLATYAPQLTIHGFGGAFESDFDKLMKTHPGAAELSLRRRPIRRRAAVNIARQYVQGELFGPTPQHFSHFEYLVWLLARDSEWLPREIRSLLRRGMREWEVWPNDLSKFGAASLIEGIVDAREAKMAYALTPTTKLELLSAFSQALDSLGLTDDPPSILRTFLRLKYIEYMVENRRAERIRRAEARRKG